MLKDCDHSHWLSVTSHGSDIILRQTDRLRILTDQIPEADVKSPTLWVFVGSAAKVLALRDVVSLANNRSNKCGRRQGDIHLHLDATSVFTEQPVFLADTNILPQKSKPRLRKGDRCHETWRRTVPRIRHDASAVDDYRPFESLHYRILIPFADILCFFLADFEDLRPIVRYLSAWSQAPRPTTPFKVGPRVVLVKETQSPCRALEDELSIQFIAALDAETNEPISTRLSNIDIVCLYPRGSLSSKARHRPLTDYLATTSREVQSVRAQSRMLFSARHVSALFTSASDHFIDTPAESFDYIRASRLCNPLSVDIEIRLADFLSKFNTIREVLDIAIPTIASSFLLDNYPPQMHRFDPAIVFETLYKDLCYTVGRMTTTALSSPSQLLLPSGFVDAIRRHLTQLFDLLVHADGVSAAEIHAKTLQQFKSVWTRLRSDTTCLTCLARRPQYGLPCGHSVCETCVRIYGVGHLLDRWTFEIKNCFLCGVAFARTLVKVKPDAAGVRILSIDGGGVRGVVPLQILKILEDRVGLPYPIQDHFDGAFGISSGSLSILAMFVNGWSVDKCVTSFESLATKAFEARRVSRIPLIGPLHNLIVAYLADGLYASENLENALKATFGSQKTILDCSYATATGAKIGIPVTTIKQTSSCIFTNYNGVGVRPAGCGYHVVRTRASVWEIARCACAAPGYWRPKHMASVGWFQDGGLWRNNPILTALSEVHAIWPSIDEPDFVVSLGTGYACEEADLPSMAGPRSILKDGFISRLVRAFMSSLSGRKMWQEFHASKHINEEDSYFRFDVKFTGSEPRLDDTSQMQSLKLQTQGTISESKEIDQLARSVVASLFYFELERLPEFYRGQLVCTGHIMCRLRTDHPAFAKLLPRLSNASSCFIAQGKSLQLGLDDRSNIGIDGSFQKRVEFTVVDRQSKARLCLKEGENKPVSLSGSPFTIQSLVMRQDLEAHFGRIDHKRKLEVTLTHNSRKRQRI